MRVLLTDARFGCRLVQERAEGQLLANVRVILAYLQTLPLPYPCCRVQERAERQLLANMRVILAYLKDLQQQDSNLQVG